MELIKSLLQENIIRIIEDSSGSSQLESLKKGFLGNCIVGIEDYKWGGSGEDDDADPLSQNEKDKITSSIEDYFKKIESIIPARAKISKIESFDDSDFFEIVILCSLGLSTLAIVILVESDPDMGQYVTFGLNAGCFLKEEYLTDRVKSKLSDSYEKTILSFFRGFHNLEEFSIGIAPFSYIANNKSTSYRKSIPVEEVISDLDTNLDTLVQKLKTFIDTIDKINKKFSEWYIDISGDLGKVKLSRSNNTWVPEVGSFTCSMSGKIESKLPSMD